jgi:hypothetical protein
LWQLFERGAHTQRPGLEGKRDLPDREDGRERGAGSRHLTQNAASASAYFGKIAPITAKETANLQALRPDGTAAGDWNAFVTEQVAGNTLVQTLKSRRTPRTRLDQCPRSRDRADVSRAPEGASRSSLEMSLEIDRLDPLTGRIGLVAGPMQPFSGWVGLGAAIERLAHARDREDACE